MKSLSIPVAGAGALVDDPYKLAADWETDREVEREKSRRTAWYVAKGACALAAVLGAAVAAMALRPEPLPGVVVVDRQTGATTFAQSLDDDTVPAVEALDKGNVERFVRAREGYMYRQLQNDMDAVARMSTPEVFAPYFKPFDASDAEVRKPRDEDWKGNVEQRVEIIGTRLTGSARDRSNGREAVTDFEVITSYMDGSRPQVRQRFVATTRYEYRPKMKMKPRDRNENPFGFVVTDYRSDPMLSEAAK
jgi:type IV secretion system protein VirB8